MSEEEQRRKEVVQVIRRRIIYKEQKKEKKFADWYLFKCKCGIHYLADYPFFGCFLCGTQSAGSNEDHEKGLTMKVVDQGYESAKFFELQKKYPNLRDSRLLSNELWFYDDSLVSDEPTLGYNDDDLGM